MNTVRLDARISTGLYPLPHWSALWSAAGCCWRLSESGAVSGCMAKSLFRADP